MMDADPTWPLPVGAEAKKPTSRDISTENIDPLPHIYFADVEPSLSANDFVERLLVSGAMSVMYGESNCGKTFLALDLALHVAEGRAWFGRETTAGPVLYLALEGGNGIRNRIVAYRQEHGLDGTALPFLLVSQSLNLLDPQGDLAAIIKTSQLIQHEYGNLPILIVIDTLSRAMAGGNENAPEQMTALVAAGDCLRKETGAHCMWIHHSGKDSARGARGHSSLRAATDTEIEVATDGLRRRAEVRKQRDLDGGDVIRFTLKSVELGTNHRGKPVTSCIVEPETGNNTAQPDPVISLKGHKKLAYDALCNAVASDGQTGRPGVPSHTHSIHENVWRDRFYGCAAPGDTQDAKRRAFTRAAKYLSDKRIAARGSGQVWLIHNDQPGQETRT